MGKQNVIYEPGNSSNVGMAFLEQCSFANGSSTISHLFFFFECVLVLACSAVTDSIPRMSEWYNCKWLDLYEPVFSKVWTILLKMFIVTCPSDCRSPTVRQGWGRRTFEMSSIRSTDRSSICPCTFVNVIFQKNC